MRISIMQPRDGGKWKLSYVRSTYHRMTAASVFTSIEKRLLRSPLKEKTSIIVKYDDGTTNETLVSLDPKYLLFTLGAFLEDYMSIDILNRIFKNYKP